MSPEACLAPLELWIGPEASLTRIGDAWVDQLQSTGFAERPDDLDRLAALGAAAVRMPLLIERLAPRPGACEFGWADARLARLRRLGIRPIAGLVHHGSGPADVDLLDPGFVPRLAAFAGRLAARHPWIRDWTPVNEPLTTARFSALYGLWYPHRRDDASFVRALLTQVRAIAAAMRAVRAHVPDARLVQTEDLGHTQGTPPLAEQVAFDNERRWLGIDLLCGRVRPGHALYGWLLGAGADRDELARLADDPTPPDVVGINVYVTSERFLDHRVERYPPALRGGNGRQAYADTEAVRVAEARFGGFEPRLRDTWQRYRRPVALTEVHIGCTRDEQMRWLAEAWQAAHTLRGEGARVVAVTAWSAFGAHDWDSLLTRPRGHYEPGLFDIRGPAPRPTALATLARALATGNPARHPLLASPGWWRRGDRLLGPGADATGHAAPVDAAPLLIVGGGTLGRAFARLCARRGLVHRLVGHGELDIADPAAVDAALAATAPWAVVNAAGFVRVDDAEQEAAQWRPNAIGPGVLAAACERHGARLLSFSSDLVFDGAQRVPYVESDPARPLNAYGRAKHAAERRLARHGCALVIRTAAFFGPWDEANFPRQGLGLLRAGRDWRAADDQVVSPTYVPDLVDASLDLLIDGESGVWHLANPGALSWYDFACRIAEAARVPTAGVCRADGRMLGQRARRPAFSALSSERGVVLPALDSAVDRFIAALRAQACA